MRQSSRRDQYLDDLFGPSGPRGQEADLTRVARDPISISPHEARLLQLVIRLGAVRTALEVGTLHGYSALAMAWALPDGGRITTIEKDPVRAAAAERTFRTSPVGARVDRRVGDASAILPTLTAEFDLIFIDANKTAYPRYLDWAEANVRRGGFIVGDNTFLWGAVYDEASREVGRGQLAAMREFNARLADPARYDATLIPTAEGLTVARKLF